MKKYFTYFVFVLFISVSFSSCLEDNDDEYQKYLENLDKERIERYEQYKADSILIVDYLADNDSVAIYHEDSGIYYNILTAGDDYYPNVYSVVEVKYKGMLLDGTVFDETNNDETVSFTLGNLIWGWQVGIPLIGSGGKIILYLPSYYGYGKIEKEKIPANSVLIFEVELINFY